MPLTKKTYRKKRYYRRQAKLNPRQKRQVKRMVGTTEEQKYLDVTSTGTGINSGGTIINLSPVTQGSSAIQRTGDKIYAKSLELYQNFLFGDATNFIRVIVFQWLQNTATALPVIGTILANSGLPIQSPINQVNIGTAFKICSDRTYSMSSTGDSGALVRNVKYYGKRLGRHVLEFNPGVSTGFYQYYVLIVSDSIAAPNPTYNLYSRLWYTDA